MAMRLPTRIPINPQAAALMTKLNHGTGPLSRTATSEGARLLGHTDLAFTC